MAGSRYGPLFDDYPQPFDFLLATESLACDLVEWDGWKWRGVGGGDGEGRIGGASRGIRRI